MSARDELRDLHYRATDMLSRVVDTLAEDVTHEYGGTYEDQKEHALSQAEREVEDLLVDLVRAKRKEPVGSDPAMQFER